MNDPKVIRILIADDHAVVRQGLSALINTQPDMKVVAEATNGGEAVKLFFQHRPDVAMVDLRMPQIDGQHVILTICERAADARVIVLTTYDDDEDIYRAFKAGAKGYLLKEASKEELLECIRRVHAGNSDVTPAIASKLAGRLSRPALTERELAVLRLLAEGKSNLEIGKLLHIGEGTVKVHVNHILDKLGVNNRTAAGVAALERGLIRRR